MPPNPGPSNPAAASGPRKRKTAPESSSSNPRGADIKRIKRDKTQAARKIATQHADPARKNGELDLQSFLKSRAFEIKSLEDGMRRSSSALSSRAFQGVPRDMRRRTASHNAKRVPKRLQKRAKREMADDNTPTVSAKTRKPGSSRGRLRAETAKRLGILAEKKRAQKKAAGEKESAAGIGTRAARPKIRRGRLNDPPRPKSKFRKRQIHKTWLPTHLWHAKRAKMTEPKSPLWRFAVPITSTEKSYRPTHRAGGTRGAVTWDMSYMSTIGLEGSAEGLQNVLSKLGIAEVGMWQKKGEKWRSGKRSWSGWLSRESKGERLQIGPSTVVWSAAEQDPEGPSDVEKPKKKPARRLFIRIHPSAFLELWTEVLRLSTLQRPAVHATDLRFEIGSIDITGPGSTEALLGILHPYRKPDEKVEEHGQTFISLAGVTNPASLPQNSMLAFSITDPRLHYPPRPVSLPSATDEAANFSLLETLATWPVDLHPASSALFDRDTRFKATHLPSQKSLNRRKALSRPGSYPSVTAADPPIPVMLLASRAKSGSSSQGTWTLLAPWKCILPIWHGLVHYPLSSGGNPRFGGLDELRQIHFEQGVPWFPADYPATDAGFAWEKDQREKKFKDWEKRPKGKRVAWDSLDLGCRRKGEIGRGWACDFEKIVGLSPELDGNKSVETSNDSQETPAKEVGSITTPFRHLPSTAFSSLISNPSADLPHPSTVAAVRLTLVSKGVASPCARIYRLPPTSDVSQDSSLSSPTSLPPDLRQQWLSLLPPPSTSKPLPNPKAKDLREITRIPLNAPIRQRVRLLAQSLLRNPPLPFPGAKGRDDGHLLVPDEKDLIGFVTTGEFNLAEGKGVAMGTVSVRNVMEGMRCAKEAGDKGGKLCIVRNAGETIGRLAKWEVV